MKPVDGPLQLPGGSCVVEAQAWRGAASSPTQECVPEEVPVALEYNGVSHAVMLATPTDLDDFALGFSLTEGLIESAADWLDCETEGRSQGIVMHLRITARCDLRLKARRRNLAGRTGCGLCGTDSLDQVLRSPRRALPPTRIAPAALARAMNELTRVQPLQHATGATHAAGWCNNAGHVQLVREDVGRHNALDKLVGALARSGGPAGTGLIAVTSRASVEMVQKTAAAGVALLAARSAPTRLAIDAAQRAGLLLAGFVRDGRGTGYSGGERLVEAG
jgi:FdhD protein